MRTCLPERNLDVLRALAVLCVVADHFTWPFTNGGLSQVGEFGVFLFFVHTSLVLMASLERIAGRATTRGELLRTFYVRRAFRIYPLAWAAIALVLLVHMPRTITALPTMHVLHFERPSVADLLTNLTLTCNIGPTHLQLLGPLWSLPIEVQMYVLLPALWWVARRPDGGRWLAAIIAVSIPLGLVARYKFPDWPVVWRSPTVLYFTPCFLGGILAYRLLRTRQRDGKAAPQPAWVWFPVIAGAALVFALAHLAGPVEWRGWVACLALGLATPFVRELPDSWLTRGGKQVATYSYGVYLLHVPAQWVGIVVLQHESWAIRWGATLALLVLLPVAAYHLIEAPGIRIGQRLVDPRERRASVPAATAPAP